MGISILYIPPRSAPPSLMAFKEPFSSDVYIAILVIFIFAAFIIYFLARLSRRLKDKDIDDNKDKANGWKSSFQLDFLRTNGRSLEIASETLRSESSLSSPAP